MEDILEPGYQLIYDGSRSSEITKFTIEYPLIKPSLSYNFKINSKNCFWYSSDLIFNTLTGAEPLAITTAP